ncbi:hypothetical protein GCM10027346_34190 [Hymenobacter seoulensis]
MGSPGFENGRKLLRTLQTSNPAKRKYRRKKLPRNAHCPSPSRPPPRKRYTSTTVSDKSRRATIDPKYATIKFCALAFTILAVIQYVSNVRSAKKLKVYTVNG